MKEQCSGVELLGISIIWGVDNTPLAQGLTPVMNYIPGDAQVI